MSSTCNDIRRLIFAVPECRWKMARHFMALLCHVRFNSTLGFNSDLTRIGTRHELRFSCISGGVAGGADLLSPPQRMTISINRI